MESLIGARAKIHRLGIAHNDMHSGNVMWDVKRRQMSVIDLGLARVDERAALIEALGTRRGKMTFGQVDKPGDYQSAGLFKDLNPNGWSLKNSSVWKRFEANRKYVEWMIKNEDGLGDEFSKASIRKLPSAISKGMSKDRARQLIAKLYEGIQ